MSIFIYSPQLVFTPLFNLFPDPRLPCIICIFSLKAFFTLITAVTLSAVFTVAVFHKIITSTVPAFYFDMLFHEDDYTDL